eukprot:859700_1
MAQQFTGQPPPSKKYKRTFDTYQAFCTIITKLGSTSALDVRLFTCFSYHNGAICDECSKDKKLHGWFTKKAVKNFNYSKLLDHVKTKKHYDRISNESIKALHPRHFSPTMPSISESQSDQTDTNNNDNCPRFIMTDLERIVNGALLVHLVIKEGQPLCKVKPFNDFYHGTFIEHKMGSNWYTTALIDAMDSWQRNQDKLDIFGPEGRSQFAMALDGSSKRARSVKIIDLRGWKRGHGPVTKYGLCLDAKKSLKDENVDLSDLFTTDTGKDNVETIEKVMAHYEISDWKQLIQLALDGALQNLGKWQGCGPNIQRKYNVFMWIEWCMTHRGNLLGKSGWKTIAYIQKHWDMQKLLYRTFSQKIMSQLYCGVCFLEEERAIVPKQDSETRFNSALKPTKNINKAWKTVAKTLKYVSAEQAECKQFRRQLNARTAGRNHPPPLHVLLSLYYMIIGVIWTVWY